MFFEVTPYFFSGNPNFFRIFRLNRTFTERLFWNPTFVRILIKNQIFLGHCLSIPNVIEALHEIHDLAVSHRDKANGLNQVQLCGIKSARYEVWNRFRLLEIAYLGARCHPQATGGTEQTTPEGGNE